MRFFVTLFVLTLSTPGWSAELTACSNGNATAALAKFRQHISPAPDSPQHRWMVSKRDGSQSWTLTEYNGLRVFVQCQPVTKADELNGVQYGQIEFRYDASRTTAWPELTSAGLQWSDWTEWTNGPKPVEKTAKGAEGLLNILAESFGSRDRKIAFRKYKGAIQFEWEYEDSARVTLMPSAEVSRFLSTADAEAAALRTAEAERARDEQEKAERDREQQRGQAEQDALNYQEFRNRFKSAPNLEDYYPPGSKRREEEGTVRVRLCVDPAGRVKDTQVADSSGFPELDAAALRAVGSYRFKPASDKQAAQDLCTVLGLRFVIKSS